MANYNPAGLMPGSAIRVPHYPGFPTGQRIVRPHINLAMTQNGMVQGVHHNLSVNSYVPNLRLMQMRMSGMQTPIYKPSTSISIGKLLSFVDHLGCDIVNTQTSIQYWKTVTHNFFAEDVTMKYALSDGMRRFQFTYQVIPRFYQTFFESGVVKIHLILGNPKERCQNGQIEVECTSASIEYHFSNGIQVTAPGHLKVMFNNTLKMTSFDFTTSKFTEYLPRNLIQEFTPDTVVVNEYGIPHKTMRCLEIAEGVDYMQNVMFLTIKDSAIGPLQALGISRNMNLSPTISNNPNLNQRITNSQAQLNGRKDIKDEPNYNGAPPTPDLQASAPTPTATPTPAPTPTPTPSLTPSPLVSNANGVAVGSPHQKHSTKSPVISDLKRGNDSGSGASKKRKSMQKSRNA